MYDLPIAPPDKRKSTADRRTASGGDVLQNVGHRIETLLGELLAVDDQRRRGGLHCHLTDARTGYFNSVKGSGLVGLLGQRLSTCGHGGCGNERRMDRIAYQGSLIRLLLRRLGFGKDTDIVSNDLCTIRNGAGKIVTLTSICFGGRGEKLRNKHAPAWRRTAKKWKPHPYGFFKVIDLSFVKGVTSMLRASHFCCYSRSGAGRAAAEVTAAR